MPKQNSNKGSSKIFQKQGRAVISDVSTDKKSGIVVRIAKKKT